MSGPDTVVPLVSVVIPVHNGERYLAEAVESVRAQRYLRVEIIVVDDGSTDGTPRVIESLGDQVRSTRQQQRGAGAARNTGVMLANGELIAFLDADDIWLPDKLALQVEAWLRHPDQPVVVCGYSVVDERLRPRHRVPLVRLRRRVLRTLSMDAWGIGLPITALIPRSLFEEVGGYRQDVYRCEDLDLSYRLLMSSRFVPIPGEWALYRTHPGQHLDAAAFERSMSALIGRVTGAGLWGRRGERAAIANLHVRLAVVALGERDARGLRRHVAMVIRNRPARLVTGPVKAATRRLLYRVLAIVSGTGGLPSPRESSS